MTPEERWQRIEEKHLALTESIELLTADMHEAQKRMDQYEEHVRRQDERAAQLEARDRQQRRALLSAITEYLRVLSDNGDAQGETPA